MVVAAAADLQRLLDGSVDGAALLARWVQDVALAKRRAQRNIVFKHFRLGEINIFFSYNGRGARRGDEALSVHDGGRCDILT